MANVCINMIHCSTQNNQNYKKIKEYLYENFQCEFYSESEDESEESRFFEGEFDSKWSFPESDFEELTSQLEADDTLYMRILSYEYGMEYVSFRVFRKGEWDVKV